MRWLPLRRFPREVIRRRQGPGMFNRAGEFEPGAVVQAILPARVQPIRLEDLDLSEGSRFLERLAVYVPTGIERVVGTGDTLTWAGDDLTLNGEPLTLGGFTGYVDGDLNPLAAAFEDREADEVEFAGFTYVVEESQLWRGSHCRAVLLRET